jgi:hypothetical protein
MTILIKTGLHSAQLLGFPKWSLVLGALCILCLISHSLGQSSSYEEAKYAIVQSDWEEARAVAWTMTNSFLQHGDSSSAIRAILLCSRIPPATAVPPEVMLTAGQMLCNQGITKQGAERLRGLIRRSHEMTVSHEILAAAYSALAMCMMEERRFASAAASFRQSLQIIPSQVSVCSFVGIGKMV